jgi:hypothetical protein
MALEQAVHAQARQRALGHRAALLQETDDLIDGTARVLAFRRQDGLLNRGVELGLPAVGPRALGQVEIGVFRLPRGRFEFSVYPTKQSHAQRLGVKSANG